MVYYICNPKIITYLDKNLEQSLSNIKAIKYKDYIFNGSCKEIILYPTPKLISHPKFYRYHTVLRCKRFPYIGRYRIEKNIYDVVFKIPNHIEQYYYKGITKCWDYGINYSSVREVAMNLVSGIKDKTKRDDPLYVATYICSRIDSGNDYIGGIIEGRWKSTFSQGEHPSTWTSNQMIAKERLNKGIPVKYGQCWIHAEFLTGILRFLGIESKTVKVTHAIMDIYNSLGIDLYSHSLHGKSRDERVKSSQNPKIIDLTNSELKIQNQNFNSEFIYIKDFEKKYKYIEKGPIYDKNEKLKIDYRDLYDLNSYIRKGKNWNFHVWTEVKINDEWWILDPSPLVEEKEDIVHYYCGRHRYEEFKGKKFFGPIRVKDIKNNNLDYLSPLNHRYLFSCINGELRHWNMIVTPKTCRKLLYLEESHRDLAKVYYRDKFDNIIDATNNYRCSYKDYHRYHPLYFECDPMTKKIYVQYNYCIDCYLQVSLLYNNTLLYCHRETLTKESFKKKEKLIFLRNTHVMKYREICNRITVTIFEKDNKVIWNQVINL